MVDGSTRRGALWAAPALLFWQPEVRVAAHHVAAALYVLEFVVVVATKKNNIGNNYIYPTLGPLT